MFERILTKEDFEKVYPILAQSFPETEVRSKEDQLALIENEKYHMYAIEDEDGTVGGVIAAWELADDFLYIEHFATLTRRRIGFYERHGFVWNDYPYMQPPMRKGQEPLSLRLMTKPAGISLETYERYRSAIHCNVYRYTKENLGKVNK